MLSHRSDRPYRSRRWAEPPLVEPWPAAIFGTFGPALFELRPAQWGRRALRLAHGIATALLIALAEAALKHGITTFVAYVLPENHEMVSVFRRSGFPMGRAVEDGVVTVRLNLTEWDPRLELGASQPGFLTRCPSTPWR